MSVHKKEHGGLARSDVDDLVNARHADPFAVLGAHGALPAGHEQVRRHRVHICHGPPRAAWRWCAGRLARGAGGCCRVWHVCDSN